MPVTKVVKHQSEWWHLFFFTNNISYLSVVIDVGQVFPKVKSK